MTRAAHIPAVDSTTAVGIKDIPMHLTKQEFGHRLHERLLAKNMRAAELARRANLSRNNISAYVNGKSYPSAVSLQAIARALDCEPDDLLPNFKEGRIRSETMPGFQIKSSVVEPGMSWLTINRQVSTALAMQIGALLEAERTEQTRKR